MNLKIAIVEDEDLIRVPLEGILSKIFSKVDAFQKGEPLIEMLEKGEDVDLLLLDLHNNFGLGGEAVLEKLKELGLNKKVYLLTGSEDQYTDLSERFPCIKGIFSKPFSMKDLIATLKEEVEDNFSEERLAS